MQPELTSALIRIAPFILLIVVFSTRLRSGSIVAADIDLRFPPRPAFAFAWWLGFALYILAFEAVLYKAGLLELGGFRHQGLPAALMIAGMVLLAPIAEELLFRGLFLNWLTRRLGRFNYAVVAQALVFVAVHNFTWRGDLAGGIGAAQTLIDATLYAYARRYSQSLLTPIAMHATGNLVAVAEMLA